MCAGLCVRPTCPPAARPALATSPLPTSWRSGRRGQPWLVGISIGISVHPRVSHALETAWHAQTSQIRSRSRRRMNLHRWSGLYPECAGEYSSKSIILS